MKTCNVQINQNDLCRNLAYTKITFTNNKVNQQQPTTISLVKSLVFKSH